MTRAPRPFFSWRQAVLQSDLPSTTRHVLLTLGCHMNDAGESCYPSITLLARETGLSRRAVMEHVGIAKERGWISVTQHGFRGRIWRRNEYAIAWPDVVTDGDHLRHEVVTHGDPEVVTQGDREVVTQGDTSTSFNSSIEATHHVSDKSLTCDSAAKRKAKTVAIISADRTCTRSLPGGERCNRPAVFWGLHGDAGTCRPCREEQR